MIDRLPIVVNDAAIELTDVEPRARLADVLRERLHLTSVHLSCEQGIRGACTVLMDGCPAKSCVVFAFQARGSEVRTVEGLAGEAGLHPMQQAFCDNFALQCGFCTPGMILSACALLARNPDPSEAEIREGISGNLCRCTGYETIVDAVREVARSSADGGRA